MISNQKEKFITWWKSPADQKERITTSLISLWGGLWIGGLGYLIFSEPPSPFTSILYSALGTALTLAILGLIFPKLIRCVTFPFIFLGVGSGS